MTIAEAWLVLELTTICTVVMISIWRALHEGTTEAYKGVHKISSWIGGIMWRHEYKKKGG